MAQLHSRLVQEIETFHAQMPANEYGADEECERKARVLNLLVRSLDMLIRAEKRVTQTNDKSKNQTRTERLNEIESALDRLATKTAKTKISK